MTQRKAPKRAKKAAKRAKKPTHAEKGEKELSKPPSQPVAAKNGYWDEEAAQRALACRDWDALLPMMQHMAAGIFDRYGRDGEITTLEREDCEQEMLTKAWISLRKWDAKRGGKLHSYATTIMRNRLTDLARNEGRRVRRQRAYGEAITLRREGD